MKQTRYEQVANKIVTLIQNGALQEGDKIPSIRQLSRELGLSVNTIKEAYWRLEDKNYIAAVPQSGFYVKKQSVLGWDSTDKADAAQSRMLNPQEVNFCQVYAAFKEYGESQSKVNLGIAGLDSEFWPTEKMARFMGEAVRQPDVEALNYLMPPGYLPLRQQIARQGLAAGLNLSPEEIIVTNGCHEAVFLSLMALCKPGDTVVFESPIYFSLFHMLKQLDLRVIEIPSHDGEGISLKTLEFVLESQEVKAMYTISNFNNPMGFSMPSWKKKKLVRLLAGYDIPLIEDDVYGDIAFKDRPDTCKGQDKSGRVLYCSSFSKTIAPGLRIGWIAPGKAYDKILEIKTLMNICATSIEQIAVARFLKEGGYDRHLRRLRKKVGQAVRQMRQAVLAHFPKGTRVTDPDGGFLLWVELPHDVDTTLVYRQAMKKNILIAPGPLFTLKGKFSHCMRLNAGMWNPDIEKAVAMTGQLCQAQVPKQRDFPVCPTPQFQPPPDPRGEGRPAAFG